MNVYRTHLCSDLSINDLNKEVLLSGWIDTIRDHGNLVFIDLRDNYGITQCVVDATNKLFESISLLSNENRDINDFGQLLGRQWGIKRTITNKITTNEIDDIYKRPSEKVINIFLNQLKKAPFPVTVRWSRGQDIDAGCGQLATSFK